ncbi:polyubiquitin-binding protein UFD1 [Lachancea thermotolerans CBS 6340]|uniref:Ubiquitin fusion degradation protein 1 n=1 Tax=Lachancea thermotolerans (strain ATCC 56472 / CBS 6340 / NRRL Y-8284) TaxID=559295 RepID=C5DK83_LACTC|nr:KLTH0F02530p [Lachancea thermotolerans CBS 6340]CAR23884.1 KLTH0F02530p [Lachancea thermotolerans CBS 6340]
MFSGFGGFGGFNAGFVNIPQKFEDFFRCYPISMMNDRIRKDDANFGGKIFLPPSALNKLTMLNVRYPMLFELTVPDTKKVTHGGVLEFIAEEGRVYLPQWMMETLGVNPGSLLQIASTDVPLGQFVKIEPQSVDFLDISDPKAVLENVLRKFSTLTVDDIIEINYNSKLYRIKVLEVKPESSSNSICVIETDLVTDFAPPVGYVEPDYRTEHRKSQKPKLDPSAQGLGPMSQRIDYATSVKSTSTTRAFVGTGQSLSGRTANKSEERELERPMISLDNEPAPLRLPEGQLFFGFPVVLPKKASDSQDENTEESQFQGAGQSLRQSNKRRGKKDHSSPRPKAPKSPEVIEID